jgi:hypothetical protein
MNDVVYIIIYIILLIVIFVVFFLRASIFKTSISEYGTYDVGTTSSCQSSTGFCTGEGFSYTIQECIPNPKNGKGCLDDKGNQTFESKTTKTICTPTCVVSLWQINSTGICTPLNLKTDNLGDTCMDANSPAQQLVTQTCILHDSTLTNGSNLCLFTVPPGDVLPVPTSGTYITDVTGTNAQYSVGSTISFYQPCSPIGFNTCGQYGVVSPVGDVTTPCVYNNQSINIQTSCNSFMPLISGGVEVVQGLHTMGDIFTPGWFSAPMTCVDTIPNTTLPTGFGCVNPVGCIQNIEDILPAIEGSNSTVGCLTSDGNAVECIQSCLFYGSSATIPFNSAGYSQWMQDIIMIPFFIKDHTGNSYSTINNIPCTTTSPAHSVMSPFNDCFGNPNGPLDDTPIILYNPNIVYNNLNAYGMSNTCTAEYIKESTNLIYIAAPIQPYGPGIGGNEALQCVLVAIQGKDYIGKIGRNSSFTWNQIVNLPRYKSVANSVYITYSGGAYQFYQSQVSGAPGAQISMPYINSSLIETNFTIEPIPQYFSLNYVNGQTYTGISDIETYMNVSGVNRLNAIGFQNYLIYRQSRFNPYSCDPQYSYPPPTDYIFPDTAQFVGPNIRALIYGNCGSDPQCNNGQPGL